MGRGTRGRLLPYLPHQGQRSDQRGTAGKDLPGHRRAPRPRPKCLGMVYNDPNRSAWKRDRSRPGWDALLELARDGESGTSSSTTLTGFMRQPWDLEELLKIADDHGIILHGKSGNRDLSDPDDRHYLRGEVAHACRSSDDTSRRGSRKRWWTAPARRQAARRGGRKYGYAANSHRHRGT